MTCQFEIELTMVKESYKCCTPSKLIILVALNKGKVKL